MVPGNVFGEPPIEMQDAKMRIFILLSAGEGRVEG